MHYWSVVYALMICGSCITDLWSMLYWLWFMHYWCLGTSALGPARRYAENPHCWAGAWGLSWQSLAWSIGKGHRGCNGACGLVTNALNSQTGNQRCQAGQRPSGSCSCLAPTHAAAASKPKCLVACWSQAPLATVWTLRYLSLALSWSFRLLQAVRHYCRLCTNYSRLCTTVKSCTLLGWEREVGVGGGPSASASPFIPHWPKTQSQFGSWWHAPAHSMNSISSTSSIKNTGQKQQLTLSQGNIYQEMQLLMSVHISQVNMHYEQNEQWTKELQLLMSAHTSASKYGHNSVAHTCPPFRLCQAICNSCTTQLIPP